MNIKIMLGIGVVIVLLGIFFSSYPIEVMIGAISLYLIIIYFKFIRHEKEGVL